MKVTEIEPMGMLHITLLHGEFIEIIGLDLIKTSFNNAGSSSVGQVDEKHVVEGSRSLPMASLPNSVTQKKKDGTLVTERYYDDKGNAYLDIDYTDHANPKTHKEVPHQHDITFVNGKPRRGKDKKVQ